MRIFFCPAILDLIVFLVLFAVSYGAGERGMTMMQCAWLQGIFHLTYMTTSLLIGFTLSRRNARPLLLMSIVTASLAAALCLIFKGFWPIFISMAVFGVFISFFFNSFQTFMRGDAPPGGLAQVTGKYTIAWSLGSSMGFLLSGTLYRLGPVALTAIVFGVCVIVFLFLNSHKERPHGSLSAEEHIDESPNGGEGVYERYVWIAWLMIFTAMFVQRPLQTFYPALNARSGVAPFLVSLPLFLHMFIQGLFGYFMSRMPSIRYRRGPLFLIQAIAALLLFAMWKIPSYWLSAIGISVLGVWAGFAYFFAVYYASNSERRSRNIGINECLVGLGSFVSLFISEWFMRRFVNDEVMYAVCGSLLLISAAAQWLVAGKRKTTAQTERSG